MPRLALLLMLIGAPVLAQTGDSAMVFEAASVKPFVEGTLVDYSGCAGGPDSDDPGQVICKYATLRMMLTKAYGVKTPEIFGPSWIDNDRFEVIAKVPHGATREQIPAMYRNMLAERFRLAVHHETRPLPGYALTIAKGGLKIKESQPPSANPPAEDPPPANGKLPVDEDGFPILRPSVIAQGPMILFRNGRARLLAGNTTMARLAQSLSGQLNQVVVDETGLTGKYDMTLNWTPDQTEPGGRPNPTAPSEDLLTALERQLGLKLVAKKIPRDTIVIDHVEK